MQFFEKIISSQTPLACILRLSKIFLENKSENNRFPKGFYASW